MEIIKGRNLYWNNDQLRKNRKYILIILVMICFLCFLLWYIFQQRKINTKDIYYKTVESVVELKASANLKGDNYGTAVFIDDSGILVTNAHVVMYQKDGEMKKYDKLQIRLPVEESYQDVSLLKYDEELDIAVLQLNKKNFKIKEINIGNSDKIDYGDKVFSIGNMMNYGISISEGIVSSPCIEIEYDRIVREVIQSDINIASGSSGGALLDEKGKLIGITSFRLKDKTGNIVYGTGFSVPINKVIKYIYQ